MSEHDDKRRNERLDVLGELRGEAQIIQPMAIVEIAFGGAQIETAFPFQVDSLHLFRLLLGDQSIVVKARIAHCRISDVETEFVRYRTGIEFIEPTEKVLAVIEGFLEAIKSGRRAL